MDRSVKRRLISATVLSLAGLGFVYAIGWHGSGQAGEELTFVSVDLGLESDLHVARHEVSVAEWQVCVRVGACAQRPGQTGADAPITSVNWFDVQAYIAWRSKRDNRRYRLPSHEEWMLLAAEQAPIPADKLFDAPELAWAADYKLTPVTEAPDAEDAAKVNSLGLSGLANTVWEWTASCRVTGDTGVGECRSARVAMGLHTAVIPELVRDPGKFGCGGGTPPPFVGFRIVTEDSTGT